MRTLQGWRDQRDSVPDDRDSPIRVHPPAQVRRHIRQRMPAAVRPGGAATGISPAAIRASARARAPAGAGIRAQSMELLRLVVSRSRHRCPQQNALFRVLSDDGRLGFDGTIRNMVIAGVRDRAAAGRRRRIAGDIHEPRPEPARLRAGADSRQRTRLLFVPVPIHVRRMRPACTSAAWSHCEPTCRACSIWSASR